MTMRATGGRGFVLNAIVVLLAIALVGLFAAKVVTTIQAIPAGTPGASQQVTNTIMRNSAYLLIWFGITGGVGAACYHALGKSQLMANCGMAVALLLPVAGLGSQAYNTWARASSMAPPNAGQPAPAGSQVVVTEPISAPPTQAATPSLAEQMKRRSEESQRQMQQMAEKQREQMERMRKQMPGVGPGPSAPAFPTPPVVPRATPDGSGAGPAPAPAMAPSPSEGPPGKREAGGPGSGGRAARPASSSPADVARWAADGNARAEEALLKIAGEVEVSSAAMAEQLRGLAKGGATTPERSRSKLEGIIKSAEEAGTAGRDYIKQMEDLHDRTRSALAAAEVASGDAASMAVRFSMEIGGPMRASAVRQMTPLLEASAQRAQLLLTNFGGWMRDGNGKVTIKDRDLKFKFDSLQSRIEMYLRGADEAIAKLDGK